MPLLITIGIISAGDSSANGVPIHVTATLEVQLLDRYTKAPVSNVPLYLQSFREEHDVIGTRFKDEYNLSNVTDAQGMASLSRSYDLHRGEAIRLLASYISFRDGANVTYISYDEAKRQSHGTNSASITKTIIINYNVDSQDIQLYPDLSRYSNVSWK